MPRGEAGAPLATATTTSRPSSPEAPAPRRAAPPGAVGAAGAASAATPGAEAAGRRGAGAPASALERFQAAVSEAPRCVEVRTFLAEPEPEVVLRRTVSDSSLVRYL